MVRDNKGDYIACGIGTDVPEIVALQRRAVASDGSAFKISNRHAYNKHKVADHIGMFL